MLSMFTSCFPIHIVVRVWDLLTIKGYKIIYKVALGILSLLESRLLASDLSEILRIFEELNESKLPSFDIIKASLKVKIKREKIEKLSKEYEISKNNSLNFTFSDKNKSPLVSKIIIEEIIETLEEIPPFKLSNSGFSSPYRLLKNNNEKLFDYYVMGRVSFIDEKNQNDEDTVNAKHFLDELIKEKTLGDSFLIQVRENNK